MVVGSFRMLVFVLNVLGDVLLMFFFYSRKLPAQPQECFAVYLKLSVS